MERERESIVYVVTVEASCPAGACRSAGRAENKSMSQAQLNFSGLSSMKYVSCLPQSSWRFSSAGVFSWGYIHMCFISSPQWARIIIRLPCWYEKTFWLLFQLLSLFSEIWNLKELIQWKPAITWIWGEGQFLFCGYHWEQSSRVMDRSIYSPTNTFCPSLSQHRKPF